jgi:lipoyl(octanoyl) transferase
MPDLEVQSIDRIGFSEALALQESLVARRARDEIPDRLLLLEHEAVITAGRKTPGDIDPKTLPAPLVAVARGGELTWHGPGQLVGYWIRKLEGAERDLHRHLRLIEEGLIDSLDRFGLKAARKSGATGVWVGDRKIASIGVGVRHWVTLHGFALNYDVDARVWGHFSPCGFRPEIMTDLNELCGDTAPNRRELETEISRVFTERNRALKPTA